MGPTPTKATMKIHWAQTALLFLLVWIAPACVSDTALDDRGDFRSAFLIVGPDRGFQGNREIKEAYNAFAKDYWARLVFISLAEEYEDAMRHKLEEALKELRAGGSGSIVVIPLVLSESDPYLKKAKGLLASMEERLQFAPVMVRDHLAAQILEDRARALSKVPANDQLVVVGYGATNTEEAATMRRELEKLATEVRRRLLFKEATIALFFHPAAPEGVLQEGNQRAEKTIRAAGSRHYAMVVPFHLGPKHTGSMQFSRRVEDMLSGVRASYDGHEILPHPNVLLWLKKMANQRIAPRKMGVVIMPHGAGEYLNEPILNAVEPLVSRYNIEVAFGMADTEMLQEAIDRLQDRGSTHILVLRLYATSLSLRDETEYVLGLRESWPLHGHAHGSGAADPPRVRASAVLATAGGLDADPLISEVLLQRAAEVSVAPESETVILLAHGSGSEDVEGHWLQQLAAQADFIRAKARPAFRAIEYATVREDWPGKREQAIEKVRKMIAGTASNGGRALVIAARLAGPGPYQQFLNGLRYSFNGKGIAPHPNLTRWMEQEIKRWIAGLTPSIKGGITEGRRKQSE